MTSLMVLQSVRTVQLSKGYNALIDEADWAIVSQWKWSADVRAYAVYAVRHRLISGHGSNRIRESYHLHRQILDDSTAIHVDHRDGDGRNNTRDNLRPATRNDNCRNCRVVRSRWGFKGVTKNGKNGWSAKIHVNDKPIYLGTYGSPEEAARAYDRAAVEHHGDFARTNAQILGEY